MISSVFSTIAVSLLLLISLTSVVQAQSTGTLSGYVTDARTGDPLFGANVGLQGTTRGASTDPDGFYEISDIEPGTYTVVATFIGYESQQRININVRSAGNRDINFELNSAAEQLDEVVVTLSEPFIAPPENPVSFRRLSPEEISTYPAGNSDIAKVVQSLPGVSGSVTGFRNDVIIRGGAPNENVYYLDGIEIPSINHFSTQGSAGGPVGLLNVAFFEGVELSTSAFSASAGNALSGVLRFNQRTGNDREFRTNFRVGASEAALTTEGPLFKGDASSSNTTFIASVRRSYLQLLFQLIDLPFLPDYWDYQYKVDHRFNSRNRISLTGVGSIDDFRINVPGDITPNQQAILEQVPVIQQRSNTTGLSWQRRLSDGLGVTRTSLSRSWFYNDFSRYRDNENEEGLFSRNRAREWRKTLRNETTFFRERSTITAGASARVNTFRNDFFDENRDLEFISDLTFISYGGFFQWSSERLSDRLDLTAGLRFDGNTFTDSGNQIYRTLSPRAALTMNLDETGQWKAVLSAGRYFKKPPLNLLGYRENSVFVNRNTQYIRSDHLTGGINYFPRPSTKIAVEGFLKLYDRYPVSIREEVSLANLGGGFEVLGNDDVESAGKGRTYGVELLAQQTFESNYYAILAYTLFWSEFTGFDRDVFLPSAWDSRHLITFTGGYRIGNSWEFSLRTRLLGRTPYAPINEQRSIETYPAFVFDYNRLGNDRLKPFNATDIRVDRKWNFKNFSLDIYLEIQNLFGQNTPSEPSFLLQNGDNPQLVRVDQLSESSLLPTIGIILDF
ncbi:MAG: TonB-dependent receptor [Balneolaceae bacterium]|nr:MAG: TonB-dependent receptor [Balneolaceae bacterium]